MSKHSVVTVLASFLCLHLSVGLSFAQDAGWRDQIGTFKVGLVVQSGQPLPDRDLIRAAFSAKLAMPVEVVVARDYPGLIDAQASGRVDYAVYSSLAYAVIAQYCQCVAPLVLPVGSQSGSIDGRITGQRIIIRQHRDPISSGGKTRLIAAQDTQSFQAWDFVRGEEGFPADLEIVSAATHAEARTLFADRKADTLLDWEFVSDDQKGIASEASLAGGEGWRSKTVLPLGVHAVRKTIPAEARTLLLALMGNRDDGSENLYEQLEPVHNFSFKAAAEADVAPALILVERWVEAQRLQ